MRQCEFPERCTTSQGLNQETYLPVPEAGSPRPRAGRLVPSKDCEKEPGTASLLTSPASGNLLANLGIPWLVEASPELCLHAHMYAGLGPNLPPPFFFIQMTILLGEVITFFTITSS